MTPYKQCTDVGCTTALQEQLQIVAVGRVDRVEQHHRRRCGLLLLVVVVVVRWRHAGGHYGGDVHVSHVASHTGFAAHGRRPVASLRLLACAHSTTQTTAF